MTSVKISCCIKGCGNTAKNTVNLSPKIKFYSFPCESVLTPWKKDKRQKWITAIVKNTPCDENWEPKKYTRICSAHFYGNAKSEHPLHPSYIPQIFPDNNNDEALKRQVARFQRQEIRNQQHIPKAKVITNVNDPPFEYECVIKTESVDIDELFFPEQDNDDVIHSISSKYVDVAIQAESSEADHNEDGVCYDSSCTQIIYNHTCDVGIQVHIRLKKKKLVQDASTSYFNADFSNI